MFKRFLLFIFLIYISAYILISVLKPLSSDNAQRLSSYKDITLNLKNLYVEYLWSGFKRIKNINDRFPVIKKVLAINPSYTPAYFEICNSLGDYMVSGVNVAELISMIKTSLTLVNSDDLLDCYVNVLKLNSNLEEAVAFLEKLYNEVQDPYKKGLYFERIKELRDEINILNLTRAIDLYNKKFLENPKDLSMLVETGIIDRLPEDPFGGQYFISKEGRLRSTSARSKQGHK